MKNNFVWLIALLFVFQGCEEEFTINRPFLIVDSMLDYKMVEPEGADITIVLNTNRDWSIEGYGNESSWISISETNGGPSEYQQDLILRVSPNLEYNRYANLFIRGGHNELVGLSIAQAGKKGELRTVHVEDIISMADSSSYFRISGYVLNVVDSQTSSLSIHDGTGVIMVKDIKNFDEYTGLLKSGGKVSAIGRYNGKSLVDAYIESCWESNDNVSEGYIIDATINEFYESNLENVNYRLNGKISRVIDDVLGLFELEDNTGVICVNGLTATDTQGINKSFQNMGLSEGDIVTIVGKKEFHDGEIVVGSAYCVSHEGYKVVTICEFLQQYPGGESWYRMTGIVNNITNTKYGNFDLIDQTGSVFVYGLTKAPSPTNDQSFSKLDIKEGDIVTIIGKVGEYNGNIEVVNAYYVSHAD